MKLTNFQLVDDVIANENLIRQSQKWKILLFFLLIKLFGYFNNRHLANELPR